MRQSLCLKELMADPEQWAHLEVSEKQDEVPCKHPLLGVSELFPGCLTSQGRQAGIPCKYLLQHGIVSGHHILHAATIFSMACNLCRSSCMHGDAHSHEEFGLVMQARRQKLGQAAGY